MQQAPTFILQSLMGLLGMSPTLLVYLVAMIVAFVYWNRHPRPCLLVLLAVGLMLFTTVGFMVLQMYVINSRVMNQWRGMTLGSVLTVIGLVRSIIQAGAFGLLLMAVFTDRPRPVNPVGPSYSGNSMQ